MKRKTIIAYCIKCKHDIDELDIQYGCAMCRIIEERKPRDPKDYTKNEKRFFKNLMEALEK